MTQPRLLVGTRKAAFILTGDASRRRWEPSGAMLRGWSIYHMAADMRDGGLRLYAAANHPVWGPSVARSEDGGSTWDQRNPGLAFPDDMGLGLTTVWYVAPAHRERPGVVYAGVSPGGLFRSDDWGASWKPNDAINRHDFRPFWQAIPGGPATPEAQRVISAMHSIEIDPRDPQRMYLVNSGGGSYLSRDEGATWELFSHQTTARTDTGRAFVSQNASGSGPDIDPAAHGELHRLRLDPKNPDRIWAQAHTGVFRSDDGAAGWTDVTGGLPSWHGFPIAVSRRGPDAVFVVPLEVSGDNFRVCEGQFAVYRTRDDGATWERLTNGLPGPHDYQSVYREALETDSGNPEGVYVGTSNGELFASRNGGDQWERLPGTFPPILSVTFAEW